MSKKKLAIPILSCALMLSFACACASTPQPPGVSVCASTEETDKNLKVFIGDINNAPEDYVQQRTDYLKCLTSESVNALIGFNDYYTTDDVITLVEEYNAVIDRAYMWPKGETGRLMLFVEDGDLISSIKNYRERIESDDCDDPEITKDYQSFLDGKYGVFAITVTASAKSLGDMIDQSGRISYVDVLYNAEAEEYAEATGKTVSYIERPSKPDGAL